MQAALMVLEFKLFCFPQCITIVSFALGEAEHIESSVSYICVAM